MEYLKDLINLLKLVEQNLPEIMTKTAQVISNDAIALASSEIREQGFGEMYLNEYYKEYRQELGHQIAFVDLTLTGKMWQGVIPSDVIVEGTKYYCTLSHTNQEGADKFNWNYERYGDFVGKVLTGKNLEYLGDTAYEEITKRIDKIIGDE